MALQGIPDSPPHLRPLIYRALLSLPSPPSSTAQYSTFLAEISSRISSLPSPSPSSASSTPPAPPPAPPSQSERYDRLLREIERDVARTFGGLSWFGAEVPALEGEEEEDALWARIALLDAADKRQADELAERGKEGEKKEEDASSSPSAGDATPPPPPRRRTRRESLLRPLFVYAFLNPGVSYVQGMSYLAAVLFYVFSSSAPTSLPPASSSADSPPPAAAAAVDPALAAESSTFFALGALLSQLRDLYTPTLDGTSSPRLLPHARSGSGSATTLPTGLGATVARFDALLMAMDPRVQEALERKGVRVEGLVMRWWTTMFANEFHLPDVVRIWDRLLCLFPPDGEQHPGEVLSPVLGHLIDIGLAIVLLERQKILSPYSRLSEILTALQAPALNAAGSDIDRLLLTAWDIRERRLGRSKTHQAKQASISTSASQRVFGFSKKLFAAASPPPPRKDSDVPPRDASEFELNTERSSVAGSDSGSVLGRPRFGSLAFSSPRSSQDLSGNVTVVDGKVLPPPPARIDEHATIASLIEEELAAEKALQEPVDDEEYGVDDDEEQEDLRSTLASRAATGWGGLKSSFSRLASSDTAAQLSKRATNLHLAAAASASSAQSRLKDLQSSDAAAALYKAQTNAAAKAQMLQEQIAHDAPERIQKLREAAQDAQERLLATGAAERDGSWGTGPPRETPFTPPGMRGHTSPLSSPPTGSGSVDMGRQGSNGPKPLLLSSSARRAENRSEDAASEAPSSRRSSINWGRSPSSSPVMGRNPAAATLSPSPDISIPPLSRSPSSHGRSISQFDSSPSRVGAGSFRPRSSSVAQQQKQLQDDDSPITSTRLRDPSTSATALRRGGPSVRARNEGSPAPPPPSGRPAAGGRGWQLSDAPTRPRPQMQTNLSSSDAPPQVDLPPLDLGFDPSAISESVELPRGLGLSEGAEVLASASGRLAMPEREEPFVPPQEQPISPPPQEQPYPQETPFSPPSEQTPPRKSSLANSFSSAAPPSSIASQRTSSLSSSADLAPTLSASTSTSTSTTSEAEAPAPDADADAPLSAAPSLSRSKLVRRPAAQRKRTSRTSISTAASVDLSGAEARRVASEFLTRSNSRKSGDGEAVGVGGSGGTRTSTSIHRKRQSEGGSRMSRVEFDEADFLDAYGDEVDEEDGRD
ncbi:hypothetical protein JCM10213v2_007963 [Rhodosporidiobolus nylandii]